VPAYIWFFGIEMRSAYRRLQIIAQQLAQRKAEQLEVTRAMLSELDARRHLAAIGSGIKHF
jgi:hypothetical protein